MSERSFTANVSERGVAYGSKNNPFQEVEYSEILRCMKTARAVDIAANVLLIAGAVYFIAFFNQGIKFNWLIIGIVGLVVGAVLKFLARFKLPVNLEYSLDAFASEAHRNRVKAWNTFLSCASVWQIVSATAISDQRNNSGALASIQRETIKRPVKTPFYIKANQPAVCIKLKGERLVILPDAIITQRGGKFAAADLGSVQIKVYSGKFVESTGAVPSDAEIIEQTWQFVNQDGSPDRRHAENAQLPVCVYGYLELSGSGLDVKLSCSRQNGIDGFSSNFQTAP